MKREKIGILISLLHEEYEIRAIRLSVGHLQSRGGEEHPFTAAFRQV